ncbi:hypothetical protein BVK86_02670 [Pseudomonas reinekei]|uniref:Uncharacterized protein n=1 Tax=Pseudomonas reinekei TaxID=395598 RepID=A0A1Q9X2A0_PSERE|nr:hypothetical protein F7R15_02680 [Pseudomonas reinekei]OLU05198.1 hypothetical protein BVK86_02670 [Pseudomonas reinekei]
MVQILLTNFAFEPVVADPGSDLVLCTEWAQTPLDDRSVIHVFDATSCPTEKVVQVFEPD